MQTDLMTMLAGDDPPAQPVPPVREDTHGPAERLFVPVQTMPGQLALDNAAPAAAHTYVGKCKTRGCKTALHVTDRTDSARSTRSVFTYVDAGADATDPGTGYLVGNYGTYARCPDHGLFKLAAVNGRYVPDHRCDARCTGATGPACDCACGGANHGKDHA